MPINVSKAGAHSDLGDGWLEYRIARLRQRHLQYGRHFRPDIGALLNRAARSTDLHTAVLSGLLDGFHPTGDDQSR
jgi:hypothetical protein